MTDFEQIPAPAETTRDFAVSELPIAENNDISDTISNTIDTIRRNLADTANESLLDNDDVIAETINGSTTEDTTENSSLRDLAEWYWGLHDDMEYPDAESADHLTDQQILGILRQQFISSDCGDFAIAVHELTGWPLVNFFSPTHGRVHSGVLHPTGTLVDFDGFTTLAALRKRYRIPDLIMGEANAQSVVGTSVDFDYEISGVDRAKVTIKFLDHPPFTTIR